MGSDVNDKEFEGMTAAGPAPKRALILGSGGGSAAEEGWCHRGRYGRRDAEGGQSHLLWANSCETELTPGSANRQRT